MNSKLDEENGRLPANERWAPRRWKACVVCAEGRWSEDLVPTVLAGSNCSFKQPLQVADPLDPERYIRTWPAVPAEEVRKSCVGITLCGETLKLLLHRRRITVDMKLGNATSNLFNN